METGLLGEVALALSDAIAALHECELKRQAAVNSYNVVREKVAE